MTATVASKIPFQDLCKLCEKLHTAQRPKKVEHLKKYIEYYRSYGTKLKDNDGNADVSFLPVLRLLVPQAERERGAYGIKEHTLAKIYIRVLCLPKEGLDAKKLLNFKAPSTRGGDSASTGGDFADVAHMILKQRAAEKGTLTVEDVNQHLDNIALKHADNNPRGVDDEFTLMIRSMTAGEQKWLIRMILKDMKFGLGQNKILSIFHPDAVDLFDVCNSLSKVATVLHDPNSRLNELEIELFTSFRPMLSERLDIANLQKIMKPNQNYILETKFDGERFQLHMKDGQYMYFSRNGYNYSDQFGRNSSQGLLTPKISKLLKSHVKSLIIDGEMMGWNTRRQCFGSKGMNFDVKNLKADSVHQPCLCVFDILMLNETILTNKPLIERLRILDGVFTDSEGVLAHSVRMEATSMDDVLSALNKSIDNREEGIVMKNIDSIYKPNNRNAGWYKIKPEYTNGVLTELDLLIIGGYYGEGKRQGLITSFLLGVAVPNGSDEHPKMFHSVGKVGIGFTAVELEELVRTLNSHWKKTPGSANSRIRECPPGLIWTKEKPDVWIEPKNSCIVQIKATELVRSTAFKTDYTPRFPRVEKVRYDKPWYNCLTVTEFYGFITNSSGVEKLTTRHVTSADVGDGDAGPSPTKRSRMQAVVNVPKIIDPSKVVKVSNILKQKEFCIMTGAKDKDSKQDLELKVIENGGTVVQNAGPNTFCILAVENTFRVKNIAGLKTHNIALVSWFMKCLEHTALNPDDPLLSWGPSDLLATTEEEEDRLALEFDKYGDSFKQHATIDSLKRALDKVEEEGGQIIPMRQELLEVDSLLFDGINPFSVFRNVFAYVDKYEKIGNSFSTQNKNLEVCALEIQFMGGVIMDKIDDGTTHIVVNVKNCDAKKLKSFTGFVNCSKSSIAIVTPDWVAECFEKKAIVDEKLFYPRIV